MTTNKITKVVVIIPTYNESENIERTINVVFNSFPNKNNFDFHILIVDGNSPDGTALLVRKLISKYPNLHLLMEKEKGGLGAAYLLGMDYSFDTLRADYVIEFDADLSHDPSKIKNFVDKIDEGYDLVLGTRYKKNGSIPKNWGIHRKMLSVLGNIFIRFVFLNNSISDWTGGYKAISKDLYKKVKSDVVIQKGYTFQISFNKSALKHGAKIAEVPFDFKDREYGKSKLGPEYFVNALVFVLVTRINDILSSNFLKICIVGTIGASIQFITFRFFRSLIPFNIISHNLSIELAVLSNFILNNYFTFHSHRIKNGIYNFVKNFIKFNLISLGSIIIQNIVMRVGLLVFNENTVPHLKDYLNVVGIFMGLICNYYLYSRIIWKKKVKK